MRGSLGFTEEGVRLAVRIKEAYRNGEPIVVPGDENRLLVPEALLNSELDLHALEDPLPLAMMATRDPEGPMALAAATRLGPLGGRTRLLSGVVGIVGETTKHPVVSKCVALITEAAFSPAAIAEVRRHATRVIVQTRRQYTTALRQNLEALMEGAIAPRDFVREFFSLTEAGNMRTDIRKKLVLSLLLSETIRPSIKFLMLENFERFPAQIRHAIIAGVIKAPPARATDLIKEELKWIVRQQRVARKLH